MDTRSIVTALSILVAGLAIGFSLASQPAQSQVAWHSCIAADLEKVDGNNPREMLEARGERRVMIPAGYVPVGGGYGRAPNGESSVVILCRH